MSLNCAIASTSMHRLGAGPDCAEGRGGQKSSQLYSSFCLRQIVCSGNDLVQVPQVVQQPVEQIVEQVVQARKQKQHQCKLASCFY